MSPLGPTPGPSGWGKGERDSRRCTKLFHGRSIITQCSVKGFAIDIARPAHGFCHRSGPLVAATMILTLHIASLLPHFLYRDHIFQGIVARGLSTTLR